MSSFGLHINVQFKSVPSENLLRQFASKCTGKHKTEKAVQQVPKGSVEIAVQQWLSSWSSIKITSGIIDTKLATMHW